MNKSDFFNDVGMSALRTSPPFAAYAFTPNDILVWLGILSAVLNIAYLAWKWRREARRGDGR
jgi:protein-S-isoprenylcysteine O-methyltransferase Ste14